MAATDVVYNTIGKACDICFKVFPSKAHVRRHMPVHTGEKPFKCSQCGKGFTQKGHMRAHYVSFHVKHN